MDFEERLQRAIQRGQQQNAAHEKAKAAAAMSEEDRKRLHGEYRLKLSEYIEECVRKVADHFPGFRMESILDERGWGAAISRDDFGRSSGGGRQNLYSRLELAVPPFGSHHVLEVTIKATIRNRELLNRSFYRPLSEVILENFVEQVDMWAIEFAETYAAQ